MPLIEVKRKKITAAVGQVPTSTCAVVMPMTVERVGAEAKSDKDEPERVDDVADAFKKFQPSLKFSGTIGEEEVPFNAEFRFRSIKDFEPENLQKRQEVRKENGEVELLPNDLADLKNKIDLLYRLKKRWAVPGVRRAWSDETQRKAIIDALARLRVELNKVAGK